MLRIDSGGGSAFASEIIRREVELTRKAGKPEVASMGSVAASGGYYIAYACDYIIAHPSTITGSIGVISIFPNLEELFSKIGVRVNIIKSGEMKDSGSAFRDMTEQEKKVFQDVVDELYLKFLAVVHQKRKDSLSLDELKKIADGRIYTASQAHELQLIDEIGYFDTALKKALSLSSLKKANVVAYTYYPTRKTNIYATNLETPSLFESRSIEKLPLYVK